MRAAAASPDSRAGELPALLASYAAKVASESYRITDADFATLMAQGHGEQEIVEVTVSAALGAALCRLDAGLRAVREGS